MACHQDKGKGSMHSIVLPNPFLAKLRKILDHTTNINISKGLN